VAKPTVHRRGPSGTTGAKAPIAHTASVLISDGRVHVRPTWIALLLPISSSRFVRRWVCAGLLAVRRVISIWGALGIPLRLGVYRSLRSLSRLLQ